MLVPFHFLLSCPPSPYVLGSTLLFSDAIASPLTPPFRRVEVLQPLLSRSLTVSSTTLSPTIDRFLAFPPLLFSRIFTLHLTLRSYPLFWAFLVVKGFLVMTHCPTLQVLSPPFCSFPLGTFAVAARDGYPLPSGIFLCSRIFSAIFLSF